MTSLVEYVNSTYQLSVLPGQVIKLRCDCGHGPGRWHPAGGSFTGAEPVWVGWTPVTVDFDLSEAARTP
ncbi:hypothetical protein O7632_09670 [Solwaraspora sp. WMMD406]|uniref:hypothetical protein n=1 Tax=Solwaraspora sp. WMMD406 TaxID=3016095 RepID=UPI002415BF32|nr:hypothetical protein [Solwaraspora sp. WMMD406]MDG4764368.1 hypothetical protein [Solwaraspora sp. WMMD406]